MKMLQTKGAHQMSKQKVHPNSTKQEQLVSPPADRQ